MSEAMSETSEVERLERLLVKAMSLIGGGNSNSEPEGIWKLTPGEGIDIPDGKTYLIRADEQDEFPAIWKGPIISYGSHYADVTWKT